MLSDAQFGFRKYHSTATCILRLLDNIYRNMDSGKLTGVVFLDLKKAFDTVDHVILLRKLNTFNIGPLAIKWFDSYLKDRTQSVKSNGVKSDYQPITCGVPQGSILGPLLFILYINDLYTFLNDASVSLYADDTALYTSASTQIEIKLTLQIELTVVCEWLKANKLTLNANKTKYVIFGTKQQLTTKPDLNLYVGQDKIDRVESMKYLGVILDDHLSFDEHIKYIINKSSKKLGVLQRSREFLNKSTKILLYKSLVLPHLDYCDIVYMCIKEENLHKLQKIQNCACRIILKADKYASVKSLHQELQLPYLQQRRQIHLAMECFTGVHNQESGLHYMFQQVDDERTRETRSSNKNVIKIENIRTMTGRKAFGFRGPNYWNKLDLEARVIETKDMFKNHISKLICHDVNHPG